MCLAGQPPAEYANAAEAMAMAQAGLGWLAAADAASLTARSGRWICGKNNNPGGTKPPPRLIVAH